METLPAYASVLDSFLLRSLEALAGTHALADVAQSARASSGDGVRDVVQSDSD